LNQQFEFSTGHSLYIEEKSLIKAANANPNLQRAGKIKKNGSIALPAG